MLLLAKRNGSKENPLTIDESKEELSLRYERLSIKTETAKISELSEELNSKVIVKIAVKLFIRRHKANKCR
jgi:hypothetical protein